MAAGSVSRILSATRMLRDGHSSGPRITARLKRPTRRFDAPSRHASRRFRRFLLQLLPNLPNRRELPPYLVLLRVGFALPAALLRWRCALTAPFHPYPAHSQEFVLNWHGSLRMGGAVCFLWHFPSTGLEPGLPDVIRHTALWSSDFPLSPSTDDSDRPVQLPTTSLYSIRL